MSQRERISDTISAYTAGSAVGSSSGPRACTCATAAPASAASATAAPISLGVTGRAGWFSRVVSGPVGATVMITGSVEATARALTVVDDGDRFDLDQQLGIQEALDLDERARRIRLGEVLLAHRGDLRVLGGVDDVVSD